MSGLNKKELICGILKMNIISVGFLVPLDGQPVDISRVS